MLSNAFVTFSPRASWTSTVSADILEIASPVVISTSKNETSCFRTASRYRDRMRIDCLSPVIVQQDTSGTGSKQVKFKAFSHSIEILLRVNAIQLKAEIMQLLTARYFGSS